MYYSECIICCTLKEKEREKKKRKRKRSLTKIGLAEEVHLLPIKNYNKGLEIQST